MTNSSQCSTIVLVGFMGAGKTTVGRLLAKMAGLDFIDLDAEIVRLAGRTIPEIFCQDGEEVFRDLESRALCAVLSRQNMVLATGGGVVGRSENWTLMRRLGVIIYLRVSWDVLRLRLSSSTDRPLANAAHGWEQVRELFEKRLPLYQQADHTVDGEQDSRQVAEAILHLMTSSRQVSR
jgi:shikimate kinase